MFMSSREFNQQLSHAKKMAETEPVIITNRGKPEFVFLKYEDYEKQEITPTKTIIDLLADTDPACADIELEIPPRSTAHRRPVEF